MDIFKMANEIAKNMSLDDKNDLDNMDMQQMISHVTKNVLGMMNNMPGGMPDMSNDMSGQNNPFAMFSQVFQPQQPIMQRRELPPQVVSLRQEKQFQLLFIIVHTMQVRKPRVIV